MELFKKKGRKIAAQLQDFRSNEATSCDFISIFTVTI